MQRLIGLTIRMTYHNNPVEARGFTGVGCNTRLEDVWAVWYAAWSEFPRVSERSDRCQGVELHCVLKPKSINNG
eukprot:scaffold886_cov174-Ochromonas_danica.AAC.21